MKMTRFIEATRRAASAGIAAVLAFAASAEIGKPYNHLNYLDDPEEFSFAVWADMYGADEKAEGYRNAVERAIKAVNTLRPEFVMSIGDLIPFGWLRDEEKVRQQHRTLEEKIGRIVPPFFCTAGNHDICPSFGEYPRAYEISSKIWKEFRGPAYYSFVRKNVLFIVLNSTDDCRMGVRYCGLSKEQYAWFKKTLDDNKDVRWTCIFMHLPQVWRQKEWLDFELANLVKRKYTVFAGDWHTYVHARRHGRDYYVLSVVGGATGGDLTAGRDHLSPRDEYGEMDHIMWVTMTKNGPSVVNLDLNGIVAHDFINQKTSQSMGYEFTGLLIDYPEDAATWKRLESLQKKRQAAIARRKAEALRKGKTVRVSDLGSAPWNATELIRRAIAEGGRTVVFDRAHSPWITQPLSLPSNLELVFEDGAELRPAAVADGNGETALLEVRGSTNVVIRGAGKEGVLRMGGEASPRSAICLAGAGDVRIENMRILGSAGDGIGLTAGGEGRPCRAVKISGCQIEGCGGRAVGVSAAEDLLVEDVLLAGDEGSEKSVGMGFGMLSGGHRIAGCVVSNCLFSGNSVALRFAARDAGSGSGNVLVADCRFDCGRDGLGVVAGGNSPDAFALAFRDCEFVDSAAATKEALFTFVTNPEGRMSAGDVSFERCTVRQPAARPWFRVKSGKVAARPEKWRGKVRLERPGGGVTETLDARWFKSVSAPDGRAGRTK